MSDSSPDQPPPLPPPVPAVLPMRLDYSPPMRASRPPMSRAQKWACAAAIGWQVASAAAGVGSDRITIHPFKKAVLTVAAASIGLALLLALRRANVPALFYVILALFFACTPLGTCVMWFHN